MNNAKSWKDQGDPEGDAVVAALEARLGPHDGPVRSQRLLAVVGRWEPEKGFQVAPEDGGPLDPEVEAFLRTGYGTLPAWVRPDAVARAQRWYSSRRQVGQIVLGTWSLPAVYLSPEISLTLMGTGQLMTSTRRRLNETVAFVEVAMEPGALVQAPNQAAPANLTASWQWMRKVRLTHALVRVADARHRKRQSAMQATAPAQADDPFPYRRAARNAQADLGVPLDQLELCFVLLTFAWLLPQGMGRLRHAMDESALRDHIHLWACVGYMIGIDERLLPGETGVDEVRWARDTYEALLAPLMKNGNPIGSVITGAFEARLLTSALHAVLVEIQRQALPPWSRDLVSRWAWLDEAVKCLPRTIIRRMVGPQAAAILNIGRAPLLYWLVNVLALRFVDLNDWKSNIPPDLRDKWQLG